MTCLFYHIHLSTFLGKTVIDACRLNFFKTNWNRTVSEIYFGVERQRTVNFIYPATSQRAIYLRGRIRGGSRASSSRKTWIGWPSSQGGGLTGECEVRRAALDAAIRGMCSIVWPSLPAPLKKIYCTRCLGLPLYAHHTRG